jgi:hypothetical protein
MKRKVGKLIIPDEAKKDLLGHELKSLEALRDNGYVVEVIVASRLYKIHSADILVNGAVWEVKSPTTERIEKVIKKAKKQSDKIVIDTRRTKLDDEFVVKELMKELKTSRILKKAKIIDKKSKVIDIKI